MACAGSSLCGPHVIDRHSTFWQVLGKGCIDTEQAAYGIVGIGGLHLYRHLLLVLRQVEGNGMPHVVVLVGSEAVQLFVGEYGAVAVDVEASVASVAAPQLEHEVCRAQGVNLEVVANPAIRCVAPAEVAARPHVLALQVVRLFACAIANLHFVDEFDGLLHLALVRGNPHHHGRGVTMCAGEVWYKAYHFVARHNFRSVQRA